MNAIKNANLQVKALAIFVLFLTWLVWRRIFTPLSPEEERRVADLHSDYDDEQKALIRKQMLEKRYKQEQEAGNK